MSRLICPEGQGKGVQEDSFQLAAAVCRGFLLWTVSHNEALACPESGRQVLTELKQGTERAAARRREKLDKNREQR